MTSIAHVEEIHVPPLSLAGLESLLDPQDWQTFQTGLAGAGELLAGRSIWNVNSTATGGGVAEMLRSWVSYARGVGMDMRWATIGGSPPFFELTKRIHNMMHGAPGGDGALTDKDRDLYEQVTNANAEEMVAYIKDGDVVFLHDPQTAGLIPRLKNTRATIVWRCHIGIDEPNEFARAAWEFLKPYVELTDACVFSRAAYAPSWTSELVTAIVPPSIDVLAPKNREMDSDCVRTILNHVGLIVDPAVEGKMPSFVRHDGTPGRVDRFCEVLSSGPPPGVDNPLVVQVSRWDSLKDPIGVMRGFAEHIINGTQSHLVLAGPNVRAVADDPEGAQVLDRTEQAWRALPPAQRSRVHLACLPMNDVEENAAIVNALQRQATVVVQKSIQEGFGLTVAEAMWKARPVVASAVGGINDQITDSVNGLLLKDPTDLEAFGMMVLGLLRDPDRARELGWNGREHVRKNFLENRHTLQYLELLQRLLG
jgi:trehalose synthase